MRRLVRDIPPPAVILHVNTNVPGIFGRLQPVARSNLIVIASGDDRHRADDPDVVLVDNKAFEPIFGTREAIKKFRLFQLFGPELSGADQHAPTTRLRPRLPDRELPFPGVTPVVAAVPKAIRDIWWETI